MVRSSKQATIRKKLAADGKAVRSAKKKLFDEAHKSAKAPGWPEELLPDQNFDAWINRQGAISDFVQQRGRFSKAVVELALQHPSWETKEKVASWLRLELNLLRQGEAKGVAPVRRGRMLSRIEISDVALGLLEPIAGGYLNCLFQELLGIDRHRKEIAQNFTLLDRAANVEAQMQLQGHPLGVREFAKYLSVSPSTVTRWRRSNAFLERTEFYRGVLTKALSRFLEEAKNSSPLADEAALFRHAFELYAKSVASP